MNLKMTKAVIFDWGRTLFDSDAKKEFPESEEVLKYCKEKGYKLAVVSLVSLDGAANATLEERTKQIEDSFLRKYFEITLTTNTDKDLLFKKIITQFALDPSEIAIVDDRTIRGIRWGNKKGCMTIWLQKGKFAQELPDAETGQPTYIIHELKELLSIL